MLIRVVARPAKQNAPVIVKPARIAIQSRPMRVLDFDIENRPLSYLGSDFTTAEVTAISWAWCDAPRRVSVHLLGESELPEILKAFCDVYAQADMVTGHYITGHDLPMLNGALVECRMPGLSDKLVQDTKTHLIRTKGISCSQESMGAMLRLDAAKVQMNQAKWRAANRLTPEGLRHVRKRVAGDVRQHIAMRRELLALGYLAPPSKWRSGTAKIEGYTP